MSLLLLTDEWPKQTKTDFRSDRPFGFSCKTHFYFALYDSLSSFNSGFEFLQEFVSTFVSVPQTCAESYSPAFFGVSSRI